MTVTALVIAEKVTELVTPISPPRSIGALIAEALVLIETLPAGTAAEKAERVALKVTRIMQARHDKHVRENTYKSYTFNSSDETFLQGVFFVEPGDDADTAASKERRSHLLQIRETLQGLSTEDFELLCGAILESFKPSLRRQTQYRSDQGIDFYARVPWLPPFLSSAADIQVFSRFNIWIVGQAKRYLDSKVSTPDLRDLVGAVALARSGAYSLSGDRHPDLQMRLCDPVYYLFMTTGELSTEAVMLSLRSGVIALDGFGVAELVAHMGLGFDDDKKLFDPERLADALLEVRVDQQEDVAPAS